MTWLERANMQFNSYAQNTLKRFAHTAALCAFNYRCVQCTHQHLPGNCPRKINPSLPLGCVNCLAEGFPHDGHTANDLRNCKYYIKRSGNDNSAEAGTTQVNQGAASIPIPTQGRTGAKSGNGSATSALEQAGAIPKRATASKITVGRPVQNVIIESVSANNPHIGPAKPGPKSKSKANTKSKTNAAAHNVDGTAMRITQADDTKRDGGINELIRRLTQVLNTFAAQ